MTEIDDSCFVQGAIISQLPKEMQLEDYQYMGNIKPYDDEDDSSLNESDDEQIVDVMSDEKFR